MPNRTHDLRSQKYGISCAQVMRLNIVFLLDTLFEFPVIRFVRAAPGPASYSLDDGYAMLTKEGPERKSVAVQSSLMDDPKIDWTTITAIAAAVTAMVAVAGIIIAAYKLFVSHSEKKRSLTVELTIGLLTYDNPFMPTTGPPVILITASNPGQKTVTLTSVGIKLPNEKQILFINASSHPQLPCDIREGGAPCVAWYDAKDFARSLRDEGFSGKIKLIGFYRDGVGTTYKSKTTAFDIDEWLKASKYAPD